MSNNRCCMLVVLVLCGGFVMYVHAEPQPQTPHERGKAVAIDLCQACHVFEGADQAGSVGPPFVQMKQRFPQREKLRAIIHDAQKAIKPHTMMPPFGRHGLVDKKQMEELIEFIYTL